MKLLFPGYWECICCCVNVFVTVWISPPGYISWWDTLEAKRSVNDFPFFTQSLWNNEGASFHFEEFALRRDSLSTCLFSALGRYSAVTVTFFLNSSCQICLGGQNICKLFVPPPFSESKTGPLYYPSEYVVTLSPVLSKRFPGLVLCKKSSSLMCSLLSCWVHGHPVFISFQTAPNLWAKHLSVKELELDVELRSFHYIFWCFSSTKEAPIEILCSVTFDLRKSHFSSVPEFVAVGENDNEFLLGEWPKMLMTPLITLKLLFLDSNT